MRILVVDDEPKNRLMLAAMLKNLGVADMVLADNGGAALEILEKDKAFDLVMTDLWMPVMNGDEFVRRVRADERLAHLKVCLITADVEVRSTYRDIGFDMILLKPVTLDAVSEILDRVTVASGR